MTNALFIGLGNDHRFGLPCPSFAWTPYPPMETRSDATSQACPPASEHPARRCRVPDSRLCLPPGTQLTPSLLHVHRRLTLRSYPRFEVDSRS